MLGRQKQKANKNNKTRAKLKAPQLKNHLVSKTHWNTFIPRQMWTNGRYHKEEKEKYDDVLTCNMSWKRILYLFLKVLPQTLSQAVKWSQHMLWSNLCFRWTFPTVIKTVLKMHLTSYFKWLLKLTQLLHTRKVNSVNLKNNGELMYQYLWLFVVTCSCALLRKQLSQYL